MRFIICTVCSLGLITRNMHGAGRAADWSEAKQQAEWSAVPVPSEAAVTCLPGSVFDLGRIQSGDGRWS